MASLQLGPTPENESEFTVEWVTPILKKVLEKEGEIDPENVNIVEVKAVKNVLQGILSTTYVVDVDFEAPNENGDKGENNSSMQLESGCSSAENSLRELSTDKQPLSSSMDLSFMLLMCHDPKSMF